MLKPSMQELMKRVGNRYLLVNLAAQRARDIADQAEESGEELPDKAVKLALDEIADGEIVYRPGPRVEPVIVPMARDRPSAIAERWRATPRPDLNVTPTRTSTTQSIFNLRSHIPS